MARTARKPRIIRADLDGSQIVQPFGSKMFQVYFRGAFVASYFDIMQAEAMLNVRQARG